MTQQTMESSSAGTLNTENMIPQSRFNEVLAQKRELEATLAKLQTESAARDQARLIEEGKWKELAETRAQELAKLQPFQERAQTLETTLKEANAARLAQVSEHMRSLVPDTLAPEQLNAYLNKNWALLTNKPAPDIDAGAGGASTSKPVILTAEERQLAQLAGMTDAQYAEFKKKS